LEDAVTEDEFRDQLLAAQRSTAAATLAAALFTASDRAHSPDEASRVVGILNNLLWGGRWQLSDEDRELARMPHKWPWYRPLIDPGPHCHKVAPGKGQFKSCDGRLGTRISIEKEKACP